MSKTLATIDTKAPIEIGLDDLVYSGPDVENLGKFYDEMGFKQLKQALNVRQLMWLRAWILLSLTKSVKIC